MTSATRILLVLVALVLTVVFIDRLNFQLFQTEESQWEMQL